MLKESRWKNEDKRYLFEIQKFLDLVDNVENESLRKMLIDQMIRCDRYITGMAEDIFRQLIED